MILNNDTWRFYGRRAGRKLNTSRKTLLDKLLPDLELPANLLNEDATLCPTTLFSYKPKKMIFEIGFGNGEHLAEMMRRAPDNGFIGAEPFINGMSAFLKEISNDQNKELYRHVRLHMDDAMIVVRSLQDSCLDEIYILNPDPWHKVRHHKRRIVNPENLTQFSRLLKPGGKLIMSSDVPDLAEWMATHASNHSDFEWDAECSDDWLKPPDNWIPTRYETKGAKGAEKMVYLFFTKI